VSLLYFGLKFLRLKVPTHIIEKVPMPLLEEDYEWPSWDVFRDLINGDMANLNKVGIGART